MWTPCKPGKCVGKGPLRDLLEKLFNGFPSEIGEDDLGTLEIAGRLQLSDEIQDLIDAVEKHGRIRIWVEY